MRYPAGPHGLHGHGGHPFLALLLVVLLVVALGAVLFWLFRLAYRGPLQMPLGSAAASADQAIEIVRMRYARGEIGREEFLRTSVELGAPAPPG